MSLYRAIILACGAARTIELGPLEWPVEWNELSNTDRKQREFLGLHVVRPTIHGDLAALRPNHPQRSGYATASTMSKSVIPAADMDATRDKCCPLDRFL